ncbi:PTS sugar transporter subunit IIA [uncultured Limosilactobacillus sp.]|uniref:PTS sugar transporter subunit IIA n=1 Tax=uncultured Limosilactobacillus sp. TaxID=2837629 RepID=UPI0025F0245E|nr:PTS sugar transporter subunit IIA [uncultured Limosilactobacillus sp.]
MKRIVKWETSFTGSNREAVLLFVSKLLQENGLVSDAAGICEEFHRREDKGSTILTDNFAIPHTQSAFVNQAVLLYLRLPRPVDWDQQSSISRFVFVLLPDEADKNDLLAMKDFFISLADKRTMSSLAEGASQEVSKIINGELD